MPVKDAFLAGILAHVPEADRGKAEIALQGLEEGGLRQADYSRLSAEAQATKDRFDALYASNTEWFEDKKAALTETDALRAEVATLKANPTTVTKVELPKDVVTEKALGERFDQFERGAVGFVSTAIALGQKHMKDFGEILNVDELLADKRVQQLGLQGVYNDKFKVQIDAKAKAAADARDETIREEARVAERVKLQSTRSAYPVVGNEPSALDAIEAARTTKTEIAPTSVDDMAASYARLSATRTGATSLA